MLDKNLFFDLCNNYNVKLSSSIDRPMIKNTHDIKLTTRDDVRNILTPCKSNVKNK